MAKSQHRTLRLPFDIDARIKALHARMVQASGIPLTATQLLVQLIKLGLEQLERKQSKGKGAP